MPYLYFFQNLGRYRSQRFTWSAGRRWNTWKKGIINLITINNTKLTIIFISILILGYTRKRWRERRKRSGWHRCSRKTGTTCKSVCLLCLLTLFTQKQKKIASLSLFFIACRVSKVSTEQLV